VSSFVLSFGCSVVSIVRFCVLSPRFFFGVLTGCLSRSRRAPLALNQCHVLPTAVWFLPHEPLYHFFTTNTHNRVNPRVGSLLFRLVRVPPKFRVQYGSFFSCHARFIHSTCVAPIALTLFLAGLPLTCGPPVQFSPPHHFFFFCHFYLLVRVRVVCACVRLRSYWSRFSLPSACIPSLSGQSEMVLATTAEPNPTY